MLLYIFISLLILLIKMYILKVNSGVDKKTTFKIKTRITTSISSEAQKMNGQTDKVSYKRHV